ncbi:MAG: hypothetical protein LUO89_10345 [Methanothrix sp.]|nr:hypothetical protein [Methanothrix sp.]
MKSQLIVCMVLILAMLAYPAYAGCGKWVIRDNTDFLEDPIFDDAVASSTGSSATVNPDGTAKAENETEENSEKDGANIPAVAEKKVPAIDLAGKWSVKLEKSPPESPADQNTGKAIDMILIQTGDRLQGYGTLLEGGSDIPATATGSISNEGISLDVKLTAQKKDYRLDMALVSSKLEGSYELYEEEELAENGNATASRSRS